jgi:hypothetical protein
MLRFWTELHAVAILRGWIAVTPARLWCCCLVLDWFFRRADRQCSGLDQRVDCPEHTILHQRFFDSRRSVVNPGPGSNNVTLWKHSRH